MRTARVGRALCLAGAALGALGLLGWAGRLPLLFTVVPGLPAMMPNAAVALLLVGVVGAVLQGRSVTPARRVLSSFAVLPVLVIGVGSLAEYTLGTGPLIDQVIFRGELLPYPTRTSPLTALALTLIGLGILLIDARAGARARPSEWLLIFAALTALAGLATLVLGTGAVYHLAPAPVPAMAALTAVGLLLTSVGLLMHRPDVGIMAVVTSMAPGGVMFRRLAAPAVVLPTALAFILTRLFFALRIEELPLVIATVGVALTLLSLVIVGITARLLNDTQAALDASQARTHQLIAHASDGILIADRAGRFTEVNDTICRLLGLSERELLGRTADDFVAPEETNRLAAWRRELREGRTPIAEWHLRHENGTYVPVEVSATVLPDGRLEAFVRDISKRRAAEDESQRAQARIEGIISIATDAIISIDDQQRIIIFNQGAEHTFGWTKDEAVGRTIDFLIPERFRERHHLHVQAFAAEDATARRAGERGVPIYGLRKDGTEFPAEAAISRLRIADELTFTVVLRDLTERARLELELREARGFLENVLESSTDYSLVALDLDRRVLLWNEGARRIFGYTAQEMTGASADVLHATADLASGVALSLYARALDQGSAEALMRRRRKDGSTFLARLVVSRRTGPGGKAAGYLLISKDVTREHRRVEQDQLLAAIGLLLTSSLERAHVMDGAAELLVHDFADLCIVDLVDDVGSGLSISRSRVVHHDARKKT
ncbi:MAG: PAS domain S-box protein, partial [Gemmatimonadaceae bacterium]